MEHVELGENPSELVQRITVLGQLEGLLKILLGARTMVACDLISFSHSSRLLTRSCNLDAGESEVE
jgi:hypothetical protein